jgi:hypothetical protein
MSKARDQRIRAASEALLSPGERVTTTGPCWAALVRDRVPLLFLGRRQHDVALTDRRMLVFERSRNGPMPGDLVVGKRYETFTLEQVKRHRPLLQITVLAANGSRMVFEFRRGQRALAGELIARFAPQRDRESAAPAEQVEDPVATAFWGSA